MRIADLFKGSLKSKLENIIKSKRNHEEIIEEIEELLILSDVSLDIVERMTDNLKKKIKGTAQKEDYFGSLKEELLDVFSDSTNPAEKEENGKRVFLLVGVNGCGKTTTAAKLCHYFMKKGKHILLSASDTFRAAGSSQLFLWGERLHVPVIGGEKGADPGSVVYSSLQSFQSKNYDDLIIDTAGRMQTKDHLMLELEKLDRIIKRFFPDQPAETFLILDGTTGQNALVQAEKFKEFSGITSIILTKLDGTAKGGTVINVVDKMKIPVRFIGSGENVEDLLEFSAEDFVKALIDS